MMELGKLGLYQLVIQILLHFSGKQNHVEAAIKSLCLMITGGMGSVISLTASEPQDYDIVRTCLSRH